MADQTNATAWYARMWRKHYAVPPEKGAWVWWIGPMLVGAAAAPHITVDLFALVLAALAGFMMRQPLVLVVKVLAGRRGRLDWGPGVAWAAFYGALLTASAGCLFYRGHQRVVLLGAAGVPLFLWHLWLVSRGTERRQQVVDIAAAGVLALAAPAAYWTGGGVHAVLPWEIWGLMWLQASASIVHAFLRLRQRRLHQPPGIVQRWRDGALALAHHLANLALAGALAAVGVVTLLVPAAFVVPLLDGIEGVARPPIGAKPVHIGMRQLFVTGLFVLLMMWAYLH